MLSTSSGLTAVRCVGWFEVVFRSSLLFIFCNKLIISIGYESMVFTEGTSGAVTAGIMLTGEELDSPVFEEIGNSTQQHAIMFWAFVELTTYQFVTSL